ncbi:ImmA/IrrE family metallo-endopeptidase [Rhizobium laguerreae]|uniref:ImmA/IrrE family metallo-endopeptidase n=1 Tax=Rhizobium laguerreae TaxID=1076926 RepID=UPI001C917F33|nr:ImmA/IrrE family metallo-endopeptidase [Rhizobium laguerreae]MBY3320633.1 ImmA/IrrE family metallo-endopeptidase [Rhizobium laguerreae]MBY3362161.1 ImmA/IrrE family metallo-endopeptidase [Rhizobium laguerreae]
MAKVRLRRGFKSEASWYSKSVRAELGLRPHDPICPWSLAAHLDLPVIKVSDFIQIEPAAVAYLHSRDGQDEFSAITADLGSRRVIIHNDAHDRKRQAADLAHEIAHGLLLHNLAPLTGISGERNYDREIEEEASWLGPTLLVPDEAALSIAFRLADRCLTMQEASDEYGVSDPLLKMRLNVSGAIIRASRRRAA